MESLPSGHFLSLKSPDMALGMTESIPTVDSPYTNGFIDTTTLAAHDFDVDTRTGFMPPQPPITNLPLAWEAWELTLQSAIDQRLKLGDRNDLIPSDLVQSETWRAAVRKMPILPTSELRQSERTLRRAHHVLAWIMHFYIHSLPPTAEIIIPASITVPHLRICTHLKLPPVLTFSDDVLYNWALKDGSTATLDISPALDNLKCQTLFTQSRDEEEFYLSSARIELRGVEALELMRATMDEAFVGDDIAFRRITEYLHQMATVIKELKALLMAVREGCDPEVFYNQIRPWFRGMDSDPSARHWEFEGLELDPTLSYPTELSGPSAGQSSLVHALDIFLSVDRYSHSSGVTGQGTASPGPSFLTRMQSYMPRHHRGFLNHLSANPRPLRDLVAARPEDKELLASYNAAVLSLKEFRDSHMIIVTMYIVGPARRAAQAKAAQLQAQAEANGEIEQLKAPLKGTGGTDLVKFLKEVRDRTAGAIMPPK